MSVLYARLNGAESDGLAYDVFAKNSGIALYAGVIVRELHNMSARLFGGKSRDFEDFGLTSA